MGISEPLTIFQEALIEADEKEFEFAFELDDLTESKMSDLYEYTKVKILNNIKNLRGLFDPTIEQKDTLNELTAYVKLDDFRKKIRYIGHNPAIPQCFIPKDLLK